MMNLERIFKINLISILLIEKGLNFNNMNTISIKILIIFFFQFVKVNHKMNMKILHMSNANSSSEVRGYQYWNIIFNNKYE